MQEHNHKFFTIWYGVFNRQTRELKYASGGHPPAILINGPDAGTVATLQLKTDGAMIGALIDAQYDNATVTINDFNCLYIFSDGTFEIIRDDDSMWDFKEFLQLLTTPRPGHLSQRRTNLP